MTTDQIKAMQTSLGITADGFWGPKSIAACQKHLRSLMPTPHPWPDTYEIRLQNFYGFAGDESHLVNLPVEGVEYNGKPVKTIRCHIKVAASLGRIIAALRESFPEILKGYAGCFNDRPMRGGTLPSLHARGAAIDLCPGDNSNLSPWPHKAAMPLAVMEIFAREGWLPAGAFWGRDSMHFQATR